MSGAGAGAPWSVLASALASLVFLWLCAPALDDVNDVLVDDDVAVIVLVVLIVLFPGPVLFEAVKVLVSPVGLAVAIVLPPFQEALHLSVA